MGTIRIITDEEIAARFGGDLPARPKRLTKIWSKESRTAQREDVRALFPEADVLEPVEFKSALADMLQESGLTPDELSDYLFVRAYLKDKSLFPDISHRWKRAVRSVAKQRYAKAMRDQVEWPQHERVLLYEDLKRTADEGYMSLIFAGQEIPNGRVTLAICDWLAKSPLDLANKATMDPQPSYVVEAVMLDAKRQLARYRKLDDKTKEFLLAQIALAASYADNVDEFMNELPIRRSPFDMRKYLETAEKNFKISNSTKYQKEFDDFSPIENQLRYLENALNHEGDVWNRTIAERQRQVKTYQSYKDSRKALRTCAVELAPSGKAEELIRLYDAYAKKRGYNLAGSMLTLQPEKLTANGISPLRIGWRYNARTVSAKGEEVLKNFIILAKSLHEKGTVKPVREDFADDARKDRREWEKLMRSPVLGAFLKADAVASYIMGELGDVLFPPMKALPAPRPILSLPAPTKP